MNISALVMNVILALALIAAALFAALWLVFALKILGQVHQLARMRRTHVDNEIETRTAPFER
jgi:hypothetical protein